ncbi:hypothetical protein ThidrDRAFT_2402, partial [Thiorhodococcus drewsii AZ1]
RFIPVSGRTSNSRFAKKTLERPQFSFFRYGLDLLQRLITLQASFAAELLCVLGFMLDGRPFNVQHDMRRVLY